MKKEKTESVREGLRNKTAGILETDGSIQYPEAGTPQGEIICPLLANIYLYYELDLWFEKVFRKFTLSLAEVKTGIHLFTRFIIILRVT